MADDLGGAVDRAEGISEAPGLNTAGPASSGCLAVAVPEPPARGGAVAGVRRRISGKRCHQGAASVPAGAAGTPRGGPRAGKLGGERQEVVPGAPVPLRTLVINLDQRQDRWRGVRGRLGPLQSAGCLSVERLPATDGRCAASQVPASDVAHEWTTDRNARYDGRKGYRAGVRLQLTPGERGCAMSHVRAWREVAAGSCAGDLEQPVLILEDDAVPAEAFCRRLPQLLRRTPSDADVLYLGYIKGAPWRSKVAPGLYEAEYLWTTVGYVLWPRGKLVSSLPVDQPVDNWMGWLSAVRRLRAFAVAPALVSQEQEWDLGSDVRHSDDAVFDA
ncbi:unnamed protein product [Prorocentrum cordatum]|uniref:Glycosyl transferase family 25 domain-containing protein n=1 Tax=Prorocentrum cordatum TaxID=2364126 RepID=A0ABN9RHG4_9DINO|nr:unnamed protein product [Polarella glacialis]